MPVVDPQEGMLGVVTVDDVVDVVIEEATEDAHKQGGVVPLEDSYFSTGLFEFAWKRGVWLIVLFLGQLLTATVMEQNRDALQATVELALFIPLIIASGGNAGSQSSTLIIRAMAVGEAQPRDWRRVLGRELGIGLALGIILGAMGFARGLFAGGQLDALSFATAVGASILAIVTLSTTIGSLLPMLIRRVGLDPAVSSTPFIASVVDVLGLIVYFGVARAILAALL
ncbi:MAG: magnesium transporter, partial [Myxococcota bacterium]